MGYTEEIAQILSFAGQSSPLIELLDSEKLPTELQLVLTAYVFKKNLTISFVSLKEAKMRELSLLYDTA